MTLLTYLDVHNSGRYELRKIREVSSWSSVWRFCRITVFFDYTINETASKSMWKYFEFNCLEIKMTSLVKEYVDKSTL